MFLHLDDLIELNQRTARATNHNNYNSYKVSTILMNIAIIVGFGMAIAAGLFISSYTIKILKQRCSFYRGAGEW